MPVMGNSSDGVAYTFLKDLWTRRRLQADLTEAVSPYLKSTSPQVKTLAKLLIVVALRKRGEPQKALAHCNQILAQRLSPLHRAKAKALRASMLCDGGRYQEAIPIAESARDIFIEKADYHQQIWSLNILGRVQTCLGDHFKALSNFAQSLALSRTIKDEYLQWTGLNNVGSLFRLLEDDALALEHLRIASSIAKENGWVQERGKTLIAMSQVQHLMGDYQDSQRLAYDALELFQSRSNLTNLSLSEQTLANNCAYLGHYEEGIQRAKISLNYLPHKMGILYGDGLVILGANTCLSGDLQAGITIMQEGLSYHKKVGNINAIAETHLTMGETLQRISQNQRADTDIAQRALEHLEISSALSHDIQAHRRIVRSNQLQSRLLEDLNRPQEALKLSRQALETWKQINTQQAKLRQHALRYGAELHAAQHAAEVAQTKNKALSEAYEKLQSANQKLQMAARQREQLLQKIQLQATALEAQARTDSLTGLPNRRHLFEMLSRAYASHKRQGTTLSIAMLDVDHFKRINDDFTHAVGDEILAKLGELFQRNLRKNDIVGRYGGEEFTLAFLDLNEEAAHKACERVRQAIAEHPWAELRPGLAVTISIGLCTSPQLGSYQQMLAAADKALYAAKEAGRNIVKTAKKSSSNAA